MTYPCRFQTVPQAPEKAGRAKVYNMVVGFAIKSKLVPFWTSLPPYGIFTGFILGFQNLLGTVLQRFQAFSWVFKSRGSVQILTH